MPGHVELTAKDSAIPLSFVDVFAGCGGLSLGLMQAGWKGLFAIEQDPNAFATLSSNLIAGCEHPKFVWPEWLPKQTHSIQSFLKDYRGPAGKLRGKVDLLVGGPPCQGYSSAGRRSHDDPRNLLFEAYLELVELLCPKFVLVENVRGITLDFTDSSDADQLVNYSERLVSRLSKDYRVHSRVLDVSQFGVPQRRLRFFVIATRRDLPDSHICPFRQIEDERPSFLRAKGIGALPVSAWSAISDLEISRNGTVVCSDSKGFQAIAYAHPLTSFQRLMRPGLSPPPSDTRLAKHRADIAKRFGQIIHLCRQDGRLNVSLSAEMRAAFGLRKSALRVLDPEAPAPTITSMPDDLLHYSEPRTLTVRENARLQSFPDWFAFQGKYTTGGLRRRVEVPRFTQVANAVPPLIAEAIGGTLRRRLESVTLRQESGHQLEPEIPLDSRAA
jgi:DNA (cytosine-5)-methyltransferase 1